MIRKKLYTNKQNNINKQANTNKKIGFLSGVGFVITCVIGMGVFLKNGQILSFNFGNFSLTLIAWLLVGLSVLSLGVTLVVLSANTKSNLGILEWVRTFSTKPIFESVKFYFLYIYIPILIAGDTFYFIQTIQQAFINLKLHWYVVWIISYIVIIYFLIINTKFPKMIIIHSNLSLYIKLIPIIFFGIIILILYGLNYCGVISDIHNLYKTFLVTNNNINNNVLANPVLRYGVKIGFFLSIPSLFFSFDGFYYVTSLRNRLKRPKDLSLIIVIGILCILIISILVTLGILYSIDAKSQNKGTMMGVYYFFLSKQWMDISTFLNLCVAIGCLGIVSGLLNFAQTLYTEIARNNELPLLKYLTKIIKNTKDITIAKIYLYVYMFVCFAIISLIGTFAFLNLSNYNFGMTKDDNVDDLYSFINTITNWEALFTFFCFDFILIGGFIAYFKKRIIFYKKHKKITFLFNSSFALILITTAFVVGVFQATYNLISVCENNIYWDINTQFYNQNNIHIEYNKNDQVISFNGLLTNYIFSYNNWRKGDTLNNTNWSIQIKNVFDYLNRIFIGQIVNFIILIFIIFICSLYSSIKYFRDNKLSQNSRNNEYKHKNIFSENSLIIEVH